MPFIEAFRQFQFKVKKENFCNIHVSLIPQVWFASEHAQQVVLTGIVEQGLTVRLPHPLFFNILVL